MGYDGIVTVSVSIFYSELVIDSCQNYLFCQPDFVQPNSDIGGLGVQYPPFTELSVFAYC